MLNVEFGPCDGDCGRDAARKAGALMLCEPCYREEQRHLRGYIGQAQQRIAEIRVACKVELPQHVEPVAPVRTREVVPLTVPPLPARATQKPAKAPKPVEAVPAPAPKAPKAVEPVRPDLELDPDAKPGRCRVRGCDRAVHARGFCGKCYCVVKARKLDHLLLPTQPRLESEEASAARARVFELVRARPGIPPKEVAAVLGLPKSSVRCRLGELAREGLLARDFRGTYRATDAAPQAPVAVTDRLVAALRLKSPLRISDAQKALGVSDAALRSAIKNLRTSGVVAKPGKRATWGWISLAGAA